MEDILYFNIAKYTKHIKDVAAFAVKDMKVPDNFLEETYNLMPHFSIVRYGHGVGIWTHNVSHHSLFHSRRYWWKQMKTDTNISVLIVD